MDITAKVAPIGPFAKNGYAYKVDLKNHSDYISTLRRSLHIGTSDLAQCYVVPLKAIDNKILAPMFEKFDRDEHRTLRKIALR